MGKYKIELNSPGVRELLKSHELESYIADIAGGIKGKCGSGYETDTKQMGTRVIASVYTDTPEAMMDNAKYNTLLRAIS